MSSNSQKCLASLEWTLEKLSEFADFDRLQYWFDQWEYPRCWHRELTKVLPSFPQAARIFSRITCQGHVVHRPHGYPGDYEIIAKIYDEFTCEDSELKPWDDFFHSRPAVIAVRNRLPFMQSVFDALPRQSRILSVASGPCREIEVFLNRGNTIGHRFVAIDSDHSSIDFARKRIRQKEHVDFQCINAFRFSASSSYRLIYSLGLFDYLQDGAFVKLARLLLAALEPCGELIIGNFCPSNPSRNYMEFGGWRLNHRNANDLENLCRLAGGSVISVDRDPTGINLFVRVR